MTSRLTFDSAVSGPYSRVRYAARATTVPTLRAPVDGGHATPPVDEGCREGRGQRQRDEEEPGVHGLGAPDVAYPARLVLEGRARPRAAEQLDQQAPPTR